MHRIINRLCIALILLSISSLSSSQTINTYGPLNLPNTWHNPSGSPAAVQTFQDGVIFSNITGSVQCLQVSSSGLVSGTGSGCGGSSVVYTLQVNGTSLSAGDTVNLNATTPAAPSNGYAITFATSKSGTTDSVSAAIVGDGNSAHCLLGTGVFSTCGSASGVTGSGTSGYIPEWNGTTTLTNSPIDDSGSVLSSTERISYSLALSSINPSLRAQASPTSSITCSGGGSNTFDSVLSGLGCSGAQLVLVSPTAVQAATGFSAGASGQWESSTSGSSSNAFASTGVSGTAYNQQSGSPNWISGVAGSAVDNASSGTLAILSGVVGVADSYSNSQTVTVIDGVDGQVALQGSGTASQSFGAAIYARSPNIVSGDTLTNAYGLYVAHQGVTGVTNGYGVYVSAADPSFFDGTVAVGGGTNIVYRCTAGGGTLPSGALTITAANCSSSTDTGLRVE